MLGRVKGIISTDMPMLGSPWIMSGFAMLYGRSKSGRSRAIIF